MTDEQIPFDHSSPEPAAATAGAGDPADVPTPMPKKPPSRGNGQSMKKKLQGEPAYVAFFKQIGRFLTKDWISTLLVVFSIILATLFFSLLGDIQPTEAGKPATLSQVTKWAQEGQIERAMLLDFDSRVIVQTYDNGVFWAAYPKSDAQLNNLITLFKRADTTYAVNSQSNKGEMQIIVQFLLPILLLVTLFAFFSRLQQSGGADGFAAFSTFAGKGRKKKKNSSGITFDDVAGAGEATAELREIRDFLADPGKYDAVGASPPRGVLLVGPPGTGKTLLAKATAGEADATFFSISGSDFVESLVGVGAARVRDLFRKARKAAPAIIFIDELDAAGRKRGAGIGQGNDEREQTLNQMLVEMDGFDGDLGIVVMGATNRPDILDPALLRPGRFDRQITIDVPDVHGRLEILELHGKKKPMAADVNLEEIAKLTPGFSGAELANVVNEASLLTVRGGKSEVPQSILIEAIDRVVGGPATKTHHLMTRHELWVVAVHEAAHAVVTRATGATIATQKVSIVSRGRQMGTAAEMLTDKDQIIMQHPDLERQLVLLLAGAAGERYEFGHLSTGVSDDLHAATQLARKMVTSFGMSPELGPVTIGEQSGEVFLGASLQEMGSVGPATLELIDREVERLVAVAEVRASEILEFNWPSVIEVAKSLLEHETLAGHALDAVLSGVKPMEVAPFDESSPGTGSGQLPRGETR